MAKRKSIKGQTSIYKHTYKTKDQVTRTPLKTRDMARNLALDQPPAKSLLLVISSRKLFFFLTARQT